MRNLKRGFGDRRGRIGRNSLEFKRGRGWHDADHHPFDRLTKRMKLDVLDFFGKLDPHAF